MSKFRIDDMIPEIELDREEITKVLLASFTLEQLALSQVINTMNNELKQLSNDLKNSVSEVEILPINKRIQVALKEISNEGILLENRVQYITQLMEKYTNKSDDSLENVQK